MLTLVAADNETIEVDSVVSRLFAFLWYDDLANLRAKFMNQSSVIAGLVKGNMWAADMTNCLMNGFVACRNDEPIPVPQVTGPILKKVGNLFLWPWSFYPSSRIQVVAWCIYHADDPPREDKDKPRKFLIVSPWERKFHEVEQVVRFELLLAANYLDVKSLMWASYPSLYYFKYRLTCLQGGW